jgi:hypothetical protein
MLYDLQYYYSSRTLFALTATPSATSWVVLTGDAAAEGSYVRYADPFEGDDAPQDLAFGVA